MSKEDKIIKDLKKRNDSLSHQYTMIRIREVRYERECVKLKEENEALKTCIMTDHHKIHALVDTIDKAINYIDQVIMYKPCAREIDDELNTLIGILGGDSNEKNICS